MTTEPTELFKPYTLSQTLTKQKRAIFVVKFSSIGHLLVSSSLLYHYWLSLIVYNEEYEGHEQAISNLTFSLDSSWSPPPTRKP
ncbi:hypothetical protein HN51_001800 [Arachis hypogaea]